MIRFEGSAEKVQFIEDIIKKGTMWKTVPFIATVKHDGGKSHTEQGADFESRRFTRSYDIYGDPTKVKDAEDIVFRNFFLWWTSVEVKIRFTYDLRDNSAWVVVTNQSWQRIVQILPELKGMFIVTQPNQGVISATV